ncbi:NAD-dependent epimerase/dehydratase family protein [Azospira restricta]|uniref:NAD-dependent epimerase/dehydratase family protein n=1 Tax=Azospira restricta TaxID=404405 RepID=A0A974SSD8_9RHOO|nr:NAD-dependent epimerase/dehydratase family protein [Azospira restricta]
MKVRILVTGATGYIGRACVRAFAAAGWTVRAASRAGDSVEGAAEGVAIGALSGQTDWTDALCGVDVVLHLAGVAHRPQTEDRTYRDVNVDGTAQLARSAVRAGVLRFVFLSSISVHGRRPGGGRIDEATPLAAEDAYGRSKANAERAVADAAAGERMTWTVVRPPLVYGPAAPGNFRRLVGLVRRGVPLPLRGAKAPRSYIGLDNLVSALICAATHPAAANRAFVVADDEDVGTADLIRLISDAMGRPARLWWIPEHLLRVVAAVVGRGGAAERLLDPLQVDCRQIMDALGWQPPLGLREGVRRAVLLK